MTKPASLLGLDWSADDRAPLPFHYRVFGLTIASEWEVPHLVAAPAAGQPDVVIYSGAVDDRCCEGRPGLWPANKGAVLLIPDVASYLIDSGNRIVVDEAAGASKRNINLYLLGSALGAVLHQRGAFPLHANTIDIAGSAVGFFGESGAGKSTLAAWFHDRGHPVLGDDICVIDIDGGKPVVHLGMPRLRLWRGALERSGRSAQDYAMSFDNYDKYDVPTTIMASSAPTRLVALYELARSTTSELRISRLRGVDAINALVANTYRGGFLTAADEVKNHLSQCLQIAQQIPIFRAERPWGVEQFDDVAIALRTHAQAVANGETP